MIYENSKTIAHGRAVVPWSERKQAWVAVGGYLITNKKDAEAYAKNLDAKIIKLLNPNAF